MKMGEVLKCLIHDDLRCAGPLLQDAKTRFITVRFFFSPRMKNHHYVKNLRSAQVFAF